MHVCTCGPERAGFLIGVRVHVHLRPLTLFSDTYLGLPLQEHVARESARLARTASRLSSHVSHSLSEVSTCMNELARVLARRFMYMYFVCICVFFYTCMRVYFFYGI